MIKNISTGVIVGLLGVVVLLGVVGRRGVAVNGEKKGLLLGMHIVIKLNIMNIDIN